MVKTDAFMDSFNSQRGLPVHLSNRLASADRQLLSQQTSYRASNDYGEVKLGTIRVHQALETQALPRLPKANTLPAEAPLTQRASVVTHKNIQSMERIQGMIE